MADLLLSLEMVKIYEIRLDDRITGDSSSIGFSVSYQGVSVRYLRLLASICELRSYSGV